MKTDKCMIAYLALSTVMCAGIIHYNNISAVCVVPAAVPAATESAVAYIPAVDDNKPDIPARVEYAFIDEFGIPRVVIRNNGEQLYGYTLSVKYYDKDKKEMSEEEQRVEAVVPAGLTDGLDRFIAKKDGAEYISAAVTELTFLNESKTYEPYFSENLIKFSDITTDTADAPCSFIEMSEPSVIPRDGGSDLLDLRFAVKNDSERGIADMEFLVAEFAADGSPISAKPNGYITKNVRRLYWDDSNLASGAEKILASTMALNKGCASVKIIVKHVGFSDRGVWENPLALDWIASQKGRSS